MGVASLIFISISAISVKFISAIYDQNSNVLNVENEIEKCFLFLIFWSYLKMLKWNFIHTLNIFFIETTAFKCCRT